MPPPHPHPSLSPPPDATRSVQHMLFLSRSAAERVQGVTEMSSPEEVGYSDEREEKEEGCCEGSTRGKGWWW